MLTVTGKIVQGVGHFQRRMGSHPDAFRHATGEALFPGTINVEIPRDFPIRRDFTLAGSDIGEPDRVFFFEVCRIEGVWAYRIRPLNLVTGRGGHGDSTLEIACSRRLPNIVPGREVEIAFFRDRPGTAAEGEKP